MRKVFLASTISVIFVASLFLFTGSGSATQLGSGSTNFTVNPIVLSDIPLIAGDYCGNPKYPQTQNFKLGLSTSPGFLNVRWNAQDPGGIEREIGVNCWMNCNATSNFAQACAGFQTCSYRGPTGQHACSINGPRYNYNSDNNVTCRFFDPILPSLDLDIENRTFKTVDYEISTPPLSLTVGSPITVPIDVKSFGILNNTFTNNITALQNQQLVFVQNGYAITDSASCGATVRTFPSVNFLSAVKITFELLSHTSVDGTSCSADSQCGYLDNGAFKSQCVAGTCWKRLDVSMDAGLASLSEYNIYGFIALILGSAALFFLISRRKL